MGEGSEAGGASDPGVELLLRHWGDRPRGSGVVQGVSWVGILVSEALRHGYALGRCSDVHRWVVYRRSLRRLLRRVRERDLRREVDRELRLTMAVLAAYSFTCMDRVEGDDLAYLVEARDLMALYVRSCYKLRSLRDRKKCIELRIGDAFAGAENPLSIISLLRRA